MGPRVSPSARRPTASCRTECPRMGARPWRSCIQCGQQQHNRHHAPAKLHWLALGLLEASVPAFVVVGVCPPSRAGTCRGCRGAYLSSPPPVTSAQGVLTLDCLHSLTLVDPIGPTGMFWPTEGTTRVATLENVGDGFKLDIITPRNMPKQQSQVLTPSDYSPHLPIRVGQSSKVCQTTPHPAQLPTRNPHGLQHFLLALCCRVPFGKQVLDVAKQLGLPRGASS